MNELVECPNCLGTGESVHKGKYVKTCKICKGDGAVTEMVEQSFISNLNMNFDDY